MIMNLPKLYIEVTENRYDMFGEPTFLNQMRAAFLKGQGGINESVKPGIYTYSVRLNWKLQLIAELKKA